MKKVFLRTFALILALCCLLPLTVACTGGGETETKNPVESQKPAESEREDKGDETETDEPEENPSETSVCSATVTTANDDGEQEEHTYYYDTVEEAIEAHKGTGADIRLIKDYDMTEEVTFPEGVPFVVRGNGLIFHAKFTNGVVLEYVNDTNSQLGGLLEYSYISSYQTLMGDEILLEKNDREDGDLHKRVFYVFHDTEGLELGKYLITDIHHDEEFVDPEYKVEKVGDVDLFGKKYILCADGVYQYDMQEGVNAMSRGTWSNLLDDYGNGELITIPIIQSNVPFRLAYNYLKINVRFNYGVTYDDNLSPNGYCYYSNLNHLCSIPGLESGFIYVWSDFEDLNPGKYRLDVKTEESVDGYDDVFVDEATGLYTQYTYGFYTLTRIGGFEDFGGDWFTAMDNIEN